MTSSSHAVNGFTFYPEVVISGDEHSTTCAAPWFTVKFPIPYGGKNESGGETEQLLAEVSLPYPLVQVTTARPDSRHEFVPRVCRNLILEAILPAGIDKASLQLPLEAWESDPVIPGSNSTSGFHPLTAYTYIRRLVYRSIFASHGMDSLKDSLLGATREKTILVAIHMLNQSYFVTSHCVSALTAASSSGQAAFDQALRAYIKQEDGHHYLIERSINALGAAPDSRLVHWSVVASMNLLRWCAQNNAFALTNALGLFEQSACAHSDPIADLLIQLGESEAAKPVKKHFEINKREHHSIIGLNLARELGHLPAVEVGVALDATEILCALFQETQRHYSHLIGML